MQAQAISATRHSEFLCKYCIMCKTLALAPYAPRVDWPHLSCPILTKARSARRSLRTMDGNLGFLNCRHRNVSQRLQRN